jgi:hypothetical protein
MTDGQQQTVMTITIRDVYAAMQCLEKKVDRLLEAWEHRPETCPYREEILRHDMGADQREKRLTALEQKMERLQAGGLGGLSVGTVGLIVFEVGKAAHWW